MQGIIFPGLCFQGRTELAHISRICLVGFFEGLKLLVCFFFFPQQLSSSLIQLEMLKQRVQWHPVARVPSPSSVTIHPFRLHQWTPYLCLCEQCPHLWVDDRPGTGKPRVQQWCSADKSNTQVQKTRSPMEVRLRLCVLSPSCKSCHSRVNDWPFLGFHWQTSSVMVPCQGCWLGALLWKSTFTLCPVLLSDRRPRDHIHQQINHVTEEHYWDLLVP